MEALIRQTATSKAPPALKRMHKSRQEFNLAKQKLSQATKEQAEKPATPAKVAGRTVAEMSAEMTTAMAKRTDENPLRKRPAAAARADQDEERHMFK